MSSEHIYALPTGHCIRQYEVKRLLGHGNFGLTYLAYNKKLECYVAIKEMLPFDFAVRARDGTTVVAKSPGQEAALAWARERFYDEAKTLAKLQHPSILPVFDYFEDNGTAYLISPFIEGETLEDWFVKRGTPSEEELCAILRTLLNALNIVHHSVPDQIVLHRDIKPENILMERKSGVPVLIDFGNARVASGLKTSNLSAILTPGYAPFEQYQTDGKQGPWTDLYALGAVLYRAVTGKVPPWSTDRQGNDTIVRLAHNPSIKGYSSSFLAMIDKALRLRREERWQSCAEWLTALDRLTPPPSTPKTKPRFGFAITAVASVVVVGGGLAYLLKFSPDRMPPEPPHPVKDVSLIGNLTGGGLGTPDISIEQDGQVLADNNSALNFGSANVGVASELKFTIKSIGNADLAGLSANIDGAAKEDFTVSALSSGAISPGLTAVFSVVFKPSSSGERSATLHLASNASGAKNPFDLNFTGSGQQPPLTEPKPLAKAAVVGNGPIENSIGMKFVPVKVTDVGSDGRILLFSVWETRVCDYGQWKSAYLKTDHAKYAVNGVSLADVRGFCEWLSAKEGRIYRLPTDHEWSCAAGLHEESARPWREKTRENLKFFPWSGTVAISPQNYGRYTAKLPDISSSRYNDPILEVGLFPPNSLGLHDMGGNVSELCIDQNALDILVRGGSWATAPYEQDAPSDNMLRAIVEDRKFEPFSLARRELLAGPEANEIGFRCVLEP